MFANDMHWQEVPHGENFRVYGSIITTIMYYGSIGYNTVEEKGYSVYSSLLLLSNDTKNVTLMTLCCRTVFSCNPAPHI